MRRWENKLEVKRKVDWSSIGKENEGKFLLFFVFSWKINICMWVAFFHSHFKNFKFAE